MNLSRAVSLFTALVLIVNNHPSFASQVVCVVDCTQKLSSYECKLKSDNPLCSMAHTASQSKEEEHLTVKGEKCKSSCQTQGYNYYWCTTKDNSWDYCSPSFRRTRYGDYCRGNHFCDTHEKTSYNWCYLEDGSWNKCSPPPSLNRILHGQTQHFDLFFNQHNNLDEKSAIYLKWERRREMDDGNQSWPSSPYLYAIKYGTRDDQNRYELESAARRRGYLAESYNLMKRITVPLHFASERRDYLPWISTTTDNSTLDFLMRQNEQIRETHYLVKIDARSLNSDSSIVDLTRLGTRKLFLGSSQTAMEFAERASLVLVFWSIPSKAVVSITHYKKAASGEITYEETMNPDYRQNQDSNSVRHELFERDRPLQKQENDVIFKVRLNSEYDDFKEFLLD